MIFTVKWIEKIEEDYEIVFRWISGGHVNHLLALLCFRAGFILHILSLLQSCRPGMPAKCLKRFFGKKQSLKPETVGGLFI